MVVAGPVAGHPGASLLAVVCVGIGVGTELRAAPVLDGPARRAGHRRRPPIGRPSSISGRRRLPRPGPRAGHRRSIPAEGPGRRSLTRRVRRPHTIGAVVVGGAGARTRASSAPTAAAHRSATPLPRSWPASTPTAARSPSTSTGSADTAWSHGTHAAASRSRVRAANGRVSTDTLLSVVGDLRASSPASRWRRRSRSGIVIIRRQLAPVSRVSAAAREVANLELDRGAVTMPTSIVVVDPAAVHTEVGQLATALNRMLERISDALAVRHASEMRRAAVRRRREP